MNCLVGYQGLKATSTGCDRIPTSAGWSVVEPTPVAKQESNAEAALDALTEMQSEHAVVWRNGKLVRSSCRERRVTVELNLSCLRHAARQYMNACPAAAMIKYPQSAQPGPSEFHDPQSPAQGHPGAQPSCDRLALSSAAPTQGSLGNRDVPGALYTERRLEP